MEEKMIPQMKAWKTRKEGLCEICHKEPKMSKKAHTCSFHCAAKLAWKSRTK